MAFADLSKLVKFIDNNKTPTNEEQEVEESNENIGFYFPGSLPALNVLKLAMLNKTFKKTVETFFSPLTLKDLKMYHDCVKFSNLISCSPDLSGYTNDANRGLLKRSYQNLIYGQSALMPTKQVKGEEMQNIHNSLYFNILGMRGHNDGFVELKEVKMKNSDEYADIQILRDQKAED